MAVDLFEIALGVFGALDVIKNHFDSRRKIAELRDDNAKLFGMFTSVQEQLDAIKRVPIEPELDENGRPMPPILPKEKLSHLDESQCAFCQKSGKITYSFRAPCTDTIDGVRVRIMYGHFQVTCGHCKASYIQREKVK